MLQLVVDRPQRQIVLEAFEGGFHFRQLNVKLPQLFGRTSGGDVAAQQIAAFPLARLAQFIFAQGEIQLCHFRHHRGLDQAGGEGVIVQSRAQFLEQLVPLEFHRLQLLEPLPKSF